MTGRRCVIIADDCSAFRSVVAVVVRAGDEPVDVVHAATADEAMSVIVSAPAGRVAGVVLDVQMPGALASHRVAAAARDRGIPVLVVSGAPQHAGRLADDAVAKGGAIVEAVDAWLQSEVLSDGE